MKNPMSIAWLVALFLVAVWSSDASARGRHGPRGADGPGSRGFHRNPCVLVKFDADGDGRLDEEERVAAREARTAEMLKEFDTDGDGELSDEERAAAREARRAEHEGRREELKAEILKEFDADGDGELSRQERVAAWEARRGQVLEEFDADGDGELSPEERAAALKVSCEEGGGFAAALAMGRFGRGFGRRGRPGPRFRGPRGDPCFLVQFDADGDGSLSEEERAAAREVKKAQLLKEFDTDGDGELSEEEREAVREARRAEREARRAKRKIELLKEFDADGDGELSEEEREAAREARHARLLEEFDADGDGELSPEERAAVRKARCEERQANAQEEGKGEAQAALVAESVFLRGDANDDGSVSVADPVAVLSFLFRGSAKPSCMDAADANDDGAVDISDPTAILVTLFLSRTALPEPSSVSGRDPTPDGLTCGLTGS